LRSSDICSVEGIIKFAQNSRQISLTPTGTFMS
jgi:hypothetical protein